MNVSEIVFCRGHEAAVADQYQSSTGTSDSLESDDATAAAGIQKSAYDQNLHRDLYCGALQRRADRCVAGIEG